MTSDLFHGAKSTLHAGVRYEISNARTRREVSQKNHLDVVSFILGALRDGKSNRNDYSPMPSLLWDLRALVVDITIAPIQIMHLLYDRQLFSKRHGRRRVRPVFVKNPNFSSPGFTGSFVCDHRPFCRTSIGLYFCYVFFVVVPATKSI